MNNLMQHGKAVLFSLVVGFILLVAACTKPLDPCAATNCQNGGVCDDGSCKCPSGYEGAECEKEKRARFVGDYCALDNVVVETLSAIPSDMARLKSARFGQLQIVNDSILNIIPNKDFSSGGFHYDKKTGYMWVSYIRKNEVGLLHIESFKLCK
jgi:EGF-like domain